MSPGIPEYRITAIKLGNLTVDASGLVYGQNAGKIVDIPVWGAAIEGGGHRVLVDTGIRNPGWVSERLGPCWQETDEKMPGCLDVLGWRPEDVDTVINTHLHYDHCGNNDWFPHADLYVSLTEWETSTHPANTQAILYEPRGWLSATLSPFHYTFITHDLYDVLPGVRVIQTPGHSAGHQSVLVNTSEGTVCVAGDAANTDDNFRLRTPGGVLVSTVDALASMEKMRRSASRILMSHDSRITKYQQSEFPLIPDSPLSVGACC